MTNAQLPTIVANIEKLEEDRRGGGADICAAYKDAKSKGFNVKAEDCARAAARRR